jgi:DNA-binding HxlR family transcriptional regulator
MRHQSKLVAKVQHGLKGNLRVADCPSRSVLDHVTSRWGSLVLLLLLDGTRRFSELARSIGGVSEKMLAQTLQALEGDGLLRRRVIPTIPPKVEYTLTDMGGEVALHIKSLTDWVEENTPKILATRSMHIAVRTVRPTSGSSAIRKLSMSGLRGSWHR